MKKVSVIVPVFNAEGRLNQCVESIQKQSYKDIEIILVNDGSKDNSLSICRELARKDIRVSVIDKENSGAGETRNAGLDVATGEYVMFVDADDRMLENCIRNAVSMVETAHHVDLVAFNAQRYHTGTGEVSVMWNMSIPAERFVSTDIADCLYLLEKERALSYLWNKLFLRSIIEENHIRFEKQFVTGQDLDFVVKYCYHIHKCVLSNEPLYQYYKDGVGSLSSRYKAGLYYMVDELLKRKYQLFVHYGMDRNKEYMQQYQTGYVEYFHVCISNMFRKGAQLSLKEKVHQMRQLMANETIQKYMRDYAPKESLMKIYKAAIQSRMAFSAVIGYSVLFFIRMNSEGLYCKLRRF